MGKMRGRVLVGLVLAAGLLPMRTARAGPVLDWLGFGDKPAFYSPVRYWAPVPARAADIVCGPRLSVTAPDRHPEIPPTYEVLRYHHPAVVPAQTLIEAPLAPPESRAQYILGPR